MPRRAAELLVDCLRAQGADRIFCVPGESYLTLLDALHDAPDIQVVTCRHEGGAGFMAVADAKITGRPGLCAVSRGPGATNAAIAIHTAEQDAVPLVVLIGQVARQDRGRGAFQEVDYGQTFADMAKGVWEVSDAGQLPEVVARAFRGAEYLYSLRLESAMEILCLVQSHHDHAPGEHIGIRLELAHLVAFPTYAPAPATEGGTLSVVS